MAWSSMNAHAAFAYARTERNKSRKMIGLRGMEEDREGKLGQKEETERPSRLQRRAGWVSTRPIDRPDGQAQMFPDGDRDMDIRIMSRLMQTHPRFDGNALTVLKQRLCKRASIRTCTESLCMGSSYMFVFNPLLSLIRGVGSWKLMMRE